MKKIIVTGLTVLAILLSTANCGKSGSNNSGASTYAPYNPNYQYPYQYDQQYNNMYGYRPNGYCQNYQNNCIQCQIPQQPCYNYGYGGCGSNGYMGGGTVVYDPYNYYGRGNSFYMNVGLSKSW